MRLYGDLRSGNCYKVWLLARWLELPLTWVPVDIQAGDTQNPAFLAMNPNGKIPVLAIDEGDALAESNAILFYLAQGSALWPADPRQQAEVLKWLFFEQYSHEPYIAVARFIVHHLGRPEAQEARLDGLKAGGEQALAVMEQQLKQSPYLCGQTPTIADMALYAYTHVAEEGIFSLQGWPAIRAWIARLEAHPRHLSLPAACQAS
ncbi:glutathione S-transferase family protein [Aeromonas salmonicida]|jgi:glutathione S-transferase|uniref:Glutathione S-transferase domain protein n=1 Tax=Aeromonas salmonicida subsp. pectinolytica 34mel TaxID=1324960 RepID=T0PG77_AERSA|nr:MULTISPECIES: glutathione S-transferase family protein [Aeromonas]ATP10410.1 glutathione S-transferase domain protein [Aeromonas salmonicida subsp. pectinolytica 34mel]EQC03072.1 glutathione S-transferase family protein [Aeromonas salmonicida subsp. pectinolytica 34mel]TNI11012.1 glutathione S-transferase family protein [Aeromonas salmonicida]HEH9395297.1 glutathione S-transferase family protein [Aeromonas salmonicida]HEH9408641.1 glutathione S-transferase family protein [Aeromonas salmonic